MFDQTPNGSWMGRVNDTYSMLWKMIIRPPRDEYTLEDLGPAKFRIESQIFERKDLQLTNQRGQNLECSHFVPFVKAGLPPEKVPCVVYLHGNCSSRLEVFDALPVLLPRGISVFCLDFSGSGRSDGEYISLGHFEERDLQVVVEHLQSTGTVTAIGFWGRSMGAATSILRAAEEPTLAVCVLDSPFSNLRVVAEELVNRGKWPVPGFLLNMALSMIRNEVQERAGFDLEELLPLNAAQLAVCPALFATASDDTFVLPHHTEDLHAAWAGHEKELVTFPGGHNGVRPTPFLDQAAAFLQKHLADAASKAPPGRGAGKAVGSPERGRGAPASPPQRRNQRAAQPLASGMAWPPPSSGSLAGRAGVKADLIAMGFDEDVASEASLRFPSMDAAVEWILRQSSEALGVAAKEELRAPATMSNIRPEAPANQLNGADRSNGAGSASGGPVRVEEGRLVFRGDVQAKIGAAPRSEARAPLPPGVAGLVKEAAVAGQGTAVAKDGRLVFPASDPAEAPRGSGHAAPGTDAFGRGAHGPGPSRVEEGRLVFRPQAPDSSSIEGQLRALGFNPSQAREASRRSSSVEAGVEWILLNGGTIPAE